MSRLIEDFTTAFRTHPAAVGLITATTERGPVGLTASSIASLSTDPPALSFSVMRDGGSAGGILHARTFLIHLLGEQHRDIADAFARPDGPRFVPEQGWRRLPTGEPHLPSAPAALRARPLEIVEVGASRLIAAEVLDVVPGPEASPLLYHDHRYLTLACAQVL
ncbi:flavin reductase family protein [Brooklawnia cerclae]|uniref:Flavin reductase (DIM6/NTAB) family NADH-FMN oxidoreductase RutF n=1 Tax=Brooklawnia cerclae TaxID=349934 RepID=A0ABX0SC73_9ACTN|nr:flavin reductase family protein [Brooklawnia cerclae]NIH55984.1 flavin reductase (DIM6/NTAB) family NADH-FMN oxidoreductase RutF [Brooklawnia cerclae]